MSQIDIKAFRSIFGNGIQVPVFDSKELGVISPLEMEVIATLCTFFRPPRFVEVGVFEGKTARGILSASPWIKEYVGIDMDPEKLSPEFCSSFATYRDQATGKFLDPKAIRGQYAIHDPRFRLMLLNDASDLKPEIFQPYNMVFIDGDHSYEAVKRDTEIVMEGIAGRGLVLWHDYGWSGVLKLIDERNLKDEKSETICHVTGTSICFERVGIIL